MRSVTEEESHDGFIDIQSMGGLQGKQGKGECIANASMCWVTYSCTLTTCLDPSTPELLTGELFTGTGACLSSCQATLNKVPGVGKRGE